VPERSPIRRSSSASNRGERRNNPDSAFGSGNADATGANLVAVADTAVPATDLDQQRRRLTEIKAIAGAVVPLNQVQ